jgi:Lhr-like helicase
MPSWGGSKFALSSHLARRVRRMMSDEGAWAVLPPDVQEWLGLQRRHSRIVAEDEMLVETFPRGRRHFLVAYPFEGRLAHTTLAMLLTRRLERAGAQPLGFVCNDYALAVWSLKPMDEVDMDDLFAQDRRLSTAAPMSRRDAHFGAGNHTDRSGARILAAPRPQAPTAAQHLFRRALICGRTPADGTAT